MVKQEVTVKNESGLHARPARVFVSTAKQFESKLTVRKGGVDYNAKSMVMLMSACIAMDTVIELAAEGPDEAAAVQALAQAVESGLGE